MFSDIFDFNLMACMATDNGSVDENIDDDAPIVVEMNKQFSSPGSVVNLSGQDLSDWVSMQSLCARLSRSDNAKSIIYLDHCSLGRHGAAIISRSFTHVLIRAGNYVAKWLPLMNQNGRILVLSLINNDVGADGAAAVSKMLRINTGLRELNLRFNSLGSDGAQYLASALYVNDGLRFICLSCNDLCGLNTIGDGVYDMTGFAALMRALQVNTKVRTFKLAENDINPDGARHVADALRENKRLVVIDLHGNNLFGEVECRRGGLDDHEGKEEEDKEGEGDEKEEKEEGNALRLSSRTMAIDVSVLASSSSSSFPIGSGDNEERMEDGDDEVNEVNTDDDEEDANAVSVLLKETIDALVDTVVHRSGDGDCDSDNDIPTPPITSPLESPDIPYSRKQPIISLSSHLSSSSSSSSPSQSLEKAEGRRGGGGRGGGGGELLISIGKSSSLSSTDLSWNDMGPYGVHLLVSTVLTNPTSFLTYLDIHGNPLRDEGVRSLSQWLGNTEVCKLATVNLQLVGMGPIGASCLGAALATNASLTKLNMSSNNIEALGSEKLSLGLRVNNTLTDLNLRQCGLCSEGIAHIANMLQYNQSLTSLNLSSNAIDDDGATSLAATIAINKSLQTLDLSNYVKIFSPPLSAASTSPYSSPTKSKKSPKIQIIRAKKTKTSFGRIEESGMEVLALSIRSNQVHLKKLILKGHWLTPKSEAEILSAVDFRRICLVEAAFPTLQQKQQDIISTMKEEREILTSCYTPTYLRVHVCGPESEAKMKMLEGWSHGQLPLQQEQQQQQQQQGSFYSNMFTQQPAMKKDMPGVGKKTLLLTEKNNLLKKTVDPAIEVDVWSYTGGHDFHNIFRLHMRGAPLGVGIVCTSMVGTENQCRSAADIAKELYTWISLFLTYGHNARDLAVVFTNGGRFDKAWKGLNPLLGQKVPGTNELSSDKSGEKELSGKENGVATVNGAGATAATTTEKDTDTDADAEGGLMNSMHSVNLLDNSTSSSFASPEKFNDRHKDRDRDKDKGKVKEEKRQSIEALMDVSSHSSHKDPTEEEASADGKGSIGEKVSKQSSIIRRKFEESIRENLSSLLGWRLSPQTYVWDEGRSHTAMHPKIDTWLRERYKSLAKHVRVPSICKILREKCLPLLRAEGMKVIDINELLKEGQKHVRCLQNLELRHACQWLHQLGDVVVVDVTVESDSIFHAIEKKILPGNDDTKQENKLFKIILDPSWFSANILVPLVGRPSSLPLELQCLQPWGGKEFLLSSQHIAELTAPFKASLGMSHLELLLVLEHFRVGSVLTCQSIPGKVSEKVLFVPSRLSDSGKIEWLLSRGVAHIPLSQSSTDSPAVTAVLARRVSPRKPFIIPPCFFACIQAEILYSLERDVTMMSSISKEKKKEMEGTAGYKVICWDKGLGMWRDDIQDKKMGKVGTVCALIECTPKWVHNNWSQNPECAVDVIVWGEGNCSAALVQQTLSYIMRIVQKAGDIVLNGSLRSCDDHLGEEKLMVENPYAPTQPLINWLQVSFLRPGCVLHTLAMTPSDRDCGEYTEDTTAGSDVPEPTSSPVLVSCFHPQPRLLKDHLVNGYILAESPGGGKGLLRSISGSLTGLADSSTDSGSSSSGGGGVEENGQHTTGSGSGVGGLSGSAVGKASHWYAHPCVDFQLDTTVASE